MRIEDYEYFKTSGKGGCASQVKDLIDLYATILKKVKNEKSQELDGVKINIKHSYPKEVYLMLVDEKKEPVKFNLTEKTKDYIIPVFTDFCEYRCGSEKISKLFLDKLSPVPVNSEDIKEMGDNDSHFKGIVINPHSQNFMMDKEGNI